MTMTAAQDKETEKLEYFIQRIEDGQKIEADDWMPEEYRISFNQINIYAWD